MEAEEEEGEGTDYYFLPWYTAPPPSSGTWLCSGSSGSNYSRGSDGYSGYNGSSGSIGSSGSSGSTRRMAAAFATYFAPSRRWIES
jgi:hypothetical protein